MEKPKVGFIGLGNMGGPMAANIARAGYSLVVFDLNKEAYARLAGLEAAPVGSLKEVAAQSDVVFTSLPTVEASEAVWLGEEGVVAAAREGQVFVELSTVDPGLITRIGRRAAAKKALFVDAGVSGGVKKAAEGTLTIMAGGAREAFKKAQPIFGAIGQKIYHVGDLGAGMVVKLINNAIAHINVVAFLECVSVGLKAGVDVETLYEVISQGTGTSRQFETRFKNKVMKKDYQAGMKLDLVYKDSQLMQDLAAQVGVPIFLTSVSHQIFEMGRAKGFGEMDYAVLMRLWEDLGSSSR